MFKAYMHIERLSSPAVDGVLNGVCYIFPKIDGTNASVWRSDSGELCFGSRTRQLSPPDNDNQGFGTSTMNDEKIKAVLEANPTWRLYMEWLVPHTLRTYRDEAWRKYYVFDVYDDVTGKYLHFDEYAPVLTSFEIEYISPMRIIRYPSSEDLQKIVDVNTFLIRDGFGVGEGIVIKNYEYLSSHGCQTWAKIVRNEFKEKNGKVFGTKVQDGSESFELQMVEKFLTEAFVEKALAKTRNSSDCLDRSFIPKFLGIVWHDFITEELWEALKRFKNPTIDFKRLHRAVTDQTKRLASSVFTG